MEDDVRTAAEPGAQARRGPVRRSRAGALLAASVVVISGFVASSLWQGDGDADGTRAVAPAAGRASCADAAGTEPTAAWSRILRGCPLAETARTVVQVIGSAPIDQHDLDRWPDARIERTEATSWTGRGPGTFPAAANRCDRDADAVVFVSSVVDVDQDDLAVLRAASRAFSTAAATAPRARIVVIAPDAAGHGDAARLRRNLRVAARIANADWISSSS